MTRLETAPRPTRDEHKYPAFMQGPFPIRAITNERPPMAVYDPEKDATEKPSIGNAVRFVRGLSPHNKGEFREHFLEAGNALGSVRQLLGVETNRQIRPALDASHVSSQAEARMRARVNKMLVEHFGIMGVKESTAAKIVEGYGQKADAYLNGLRQDPGGTLSTIASSLDLPEDVRKTHDPLTLLNIIFDPNYSGKVRFAAERKLLLMKIIGDKELRKRQPQEDSKAYTKFLEILDNVWEGPTKGATTSVDLISFHSPVDYSCLEVRILTSEEKARREGKFKKKLERRLHGRVVTEEELRRIASEIERNPERDAKGNYVKITPRFELRTFSYKGRAIQANISERQEKDEDSATTKALRTGDVFMKDERGAEIVFFNYADIMAFIKRLYQAGAKHQVLINIHGVQNSLQGKKFEAEHAASSSETELLKFHITFHGINIELVLEPLDKWLNNKKKFGPAHSEYQIRRLLVDEAAETQKEQGKIPQASRSVLDILLPLEEQEAERAEAERAGLKDTAEIIDPERLKETLIENSRAVTRLGLS